MIRLLALIPEPWASLGLVFALVFAYLYGSVTGRGTERQKAEIARLQSQVNILKTDVRLASEAAKNAEAAEREMAAEVLNYQKLADGIDREVAKQPPADRAPLSDWGARRLRNIR